MKQLIQLFLILLGGTLCAQPRVLSNEEFKKSGRTWEQLAEEYAGSIGGVGLAQLGNSLETIVKEAVAGSRQTNYFLTLNVYVNEAGKIDLLLYGIQAAPATRDTLQKILEADLPFLLEDWQLHGMEGKKLTLWKMIRDGQPPAIRTVRKGDSLLSSMEAARSFVDTLAVKGLHLHQLELTEVPYELIYRFPNLEMLDLHKNKLTELNLDLARLPRLKQIDLHENHLNQEHITLTGNRSLRILNLHSNRLTDVPKAARACRELESLWMGGNKELQLTNRSFRKLRTLSDLNLYSCNLTTLPKGMRKLRDLEILDLYYNAFIEVPRSVTKLKRLNQLAIANNEITTLPARMDRLKNLQVLYAHHNHLSVLPDRMPRMKNLHLLDLGYNWYTLLPPEILDMRSLRELDLSGNNFTAFPLPLSEIPYLEKLHLRGNPFLRQEKEQAYLPYIKKMEKNPTEVYY